MILSTRRYMKRLIVFFFLICIALGQWQQSDELTLPKNIQVNDLTINNYGELWILSISSILKYETAAKEPLLIQGIKDGKIFAVFDEELYIVNNSNRLITVNLTEEGLTQPQTTDLIFNSPGQIATAVADNQPFIIVQDPNQLIFVGDENLLGSISTNLERFSIIPSGDYSDKQTPLYTLANNRIYSWTGGTFNNSEGYRSRLIYSASNTILDFTTAKNGNLYVLFPDSVVVLESNGEYKSKTAIDMLTLGSKILVNPVNNNVVIFNQLQKSLKTLSGINKNRKGDIITLKNNQPNPVDNYTEIEFIINQPLSLTITIYNLIGEPIKVIAKGHYPKGTHRIAWHANDEKGNLVPNGIYFYRLESNKGVAIRQLIVLR